MMLFVAFEIKISIWLNFLWVRFFCLDRFYQVIVKIMMATTCRTRSFAAPKTTQAPTCVLLLVHLRYIEAGDNFVLAGRYGCREQKFPLFLRLLSVYRFPHFLEKKCLMLSWIMRAQMCANAAVMREKRERKRRSNQIEMVDALAGIEPGFPLTFLLTFFKL